MKPCPYCAEPIQDAAIKCRYCGSLLVPEETLAAAEESAAGAPTGPRMILLWVLVAMAGLAVVAAAAGVVLLIRAPDQAAPQRVEPPRAAVPHRFLNIAWGTPVNEVAAQLASRGFRFTEQDEEGDHVFQGDIDGHPAVVVAMLARGALAKAIVVMVGEGDAAALYEDTNRRLTAEYGEPDASETAGGPPVTRWSGAGTRLWTTVTEAGDVAIHYESELWPAEARRRRTSSAIDLRDAAGRRA